MEIYDYTKHGDFRKYYDTTQKRNIWVIGYASNCSIVEYYELAKKYAAATGVTLQSVKQDEILSSRRFKSFHYIFSTDEQQKESDVKEGDVMENVHKWLRD